jgi:hypothetical protein
MAALIALHRVLFRSASLALCLSPSQRQSSELFRKVMEAYNRVDRPVKVAAESALRLELVNGSRVISLPGSEETIRGYSSPDLIILDEAARIDPDLYTSVRPMLAVSQGRVLMLSTPYGRTGPFWDAWTTQSEEWERYQIDAYECPRISPQFLHQERLALGQWWFEQEYMCQFNAGEGALFRPEDVDYAFEGEEVEAWTL